MSRFVVIVCLISTGLLISFSWEMAYGTSYRHIETMMDLETLERSILLYAADRQRFPSTADGLDNLRSKIDPPIKADRPYKREN